MLADYPKFKQCVLVGRASFMFRTGHAIEEVADKLKIDVDTAKEIYEFCDIADKRRAEKSSK